MENISLRSPEHHANLGSTTSSRDTSSRIRISGSYPYLDWIELQLELIVSLASIKCRCTRMISQEANDCGSLVWIDPAPEIDRSYFPGPKRILSIKRITNFAFLVPNPPFLLVCPNIALYIGISHHFFSSRPRSETMCSIYSASEKRGNGYVE